MFAINGITCARRKGHICSVEIKGEGALPLYFIKFD